jgi:hypothetical protein
MSHVAPQFIRIVNDIHLVNTIKLVEVRNLDEIHVHRIGAPVCAYHYTSVANCEQAYAAIMGSLVGWRTVVGASLADVQVDKMPVAGGAART